MFKIEQTRPYGQRLDFLAHYLACPVSLLYAIFARAGHEVVFGCARSNDKRKRLARDAEGNARAAMEEMS